MYKTSLIGAKYKLLKGMLGVPAGSIGYVFAEYPDFDVENATGVQVILENGNFDGFSVEEQGLYLEYIGYVPEYQDYDFQNVIQVGRDFQRGYWKWEK